MEKVVIISGLSGAGKTIALRSLEDSGYFCIDNLPVTLIEPFLSTIKKGNIKKVGIGVDIREKEFLSDAYQIFLTLKERYRIEILFLEAEMSVMLRRYKETRRPHPMLFSASGRRGEMSVENAIEEEKRFLSVVRDAADRIIDTSSYTPHQLKHLITSAYSLPLAAELVQDINMAIISFGYKFGIPQSVDILFDIRFLPNPYFIPELKPLKGTDALVHDFVFRHDETRGFLFHLISMLDFLIPRYIEEGRAYLVMGIGCTGGMHRSPAVVEEIAKYIRQKHGIKPDIIHRDMG